MKSVVTVFVCFIWITIIFGQNLTESTTQQHSGWYTRGKRAPMRMDTRLTCKKPEVYICEEPHGVILPSSSKQCNYRNVWYQEQVYRWVGGRGCLLYTPDFLYAAGVNDINLNAGCLYGDHYAPCLEIAKSNGECGCFPFDPAIEEVARMVREALITAAHGRWERCYYAASDCCTHYMDHDSPNTIGACAATFDGWTCWTKSKPDRVVQEICSEFVYSNSGPSCDHYSSKRCHSNGTWEVQTDYSSCSIAGLLHSRYKFHVAAMAVSVTTCCPAVVIFTLYQRLRNTRVYMHRNLLLAIIVKDVLVILTRNKIYIEELSASGDTIMNNNGVGCRMLAFSERLAANLVLICMLLEAVYLHKLTVATFRKKLNLIILYGFGAVIASIPAISWALVMGINNNHSCWLIYSIENIQWLLDVPRIAILLITMGLFMNILRVLLTKIGNVENAHNLYATKSTLFILTLSGAHYLMTALRPNAYSCANDQIYFYITYSVESLQGIAAAFLYCYVNREVHSLLKSTYDLTEMAVNNRVNRSTSAQSSDHMTCSTEIVSSTHEDKQHYSAIGTKIHAAEVISIQASERLAEMLDPIYEIVDPGVLSDGYENLEANFINYPSAVRLRNAESQDFYGFTKASSISIECEDWIRCISSPSSSVFNNSLNDYEVKYLEMKFPSQIRINNVVSRRNSPGNKQYDTPDENGADENLDNASVIVDEISTGGRAGCLNDVGECVDKDCIVSQILKESRCGENNAAFVADMLTQRNLRDDDSFYMDYDNCI